VHVAELWRYPVKSLAGERLESVDVREEGFPGDRVARVADANGEQVTARTKPGLLAMAGTDWQAPGADEALTRAAGPDARFEAMNGRGPFFDESPLLIATDGAIETLGYDGRRFRPNIVIGGVTGMEERSWDGRRLRIGAGGVEVDLGHLCERCVLTTFDPDTQEQDPDVLRRVNAELDGLFARNCWVARPGGIAVGDPVELI
jgi:uncharacterized protein